jgi:hypothetical protein
MLIFNYLFSETNQFSTRQAVAWHSNFLPQPHFHKQEAIRVFTSVATGCGCVFSCIAARNR